MPRYVEPQPGLADAWDAPFFFEDRRNLFYVTTKEDFITPLLSNGFGTFLPVTSLPVVTPKISPLNFQPSLTSGTNIRVELGASNLISYQSLRIQPAGSDIPLKIER
jgi:hypothetical protein